jgi:hypothetical protein
MPSDEPTLIPIDRSTFRHNPDAGKTEAWVARPTYADVTLVVANTTYVLTSTGPLTPATGADGEPRVKGRGIIRECRTESLVGLPSGPFPDPAVTERDFDVPLKACPTSQVQINRPGELVRWYTPLPDWLYVYVPTFVACRYCAAQFLHTKLEADEVVTEDGEVPIYRICPKCRESDCVDLAWEKPEDVAREMGLAT